jgi:hypothetical protein
MTLHLPLNILVRLVQMMSQAGRRWSAAWVPTVSSTIRGMLWRRERVWRVSSGGDWRRGLEVNSVIMAEKGGGWLV